MTRLFSNEAHSELKVWNYRKDNVPVQCTLKCFPLYDDCGLRNESKISHIGVEVISTIPRGTDSFVFSGSSDICDEDFMNSSENDFEIGLPLDRRENSRVYDKCGDLPVPTIDEWKSLSELSFPLALMLRYMLRSQGPIVLLDRYAGES